MLALASAGRLEAPSMRHFFLGFLCALAAGCSKSTTPEPGALQVMEKVLEPAIAAYQSGDAKALQAQFGKAAPGMGDVAVVDRIFMKFYREKFGPLKGIRLSPKETTLNRDRGMLVYDAAFERAVAKLSANFLRENGEVRLMQIRIEEIEEE